MQEVYDDLDSRFEKAFEALRRELSRVRTGRANINLLDTIRVNYYGQPTPLSQIAALQVPEPRLITIKPWESNLIKEIERTIMQSDLGITPTSDGTLIRLAVPPLTEERRKDLVKQVHRIGEDAKVSIRNSRRDANAFLKQAEKDSDITEDDLTRALKVVQDKTDEGIATVDKLLEKKESELMEV